MRSPDSYSKFLTGLWPLTKGLACLLSLIIFFSCNYDPDDEYNVDIEPVHPPAASIMINDQDTLIKIYEPTICAFNFWSERYLSIMVVNVYIDDSLITTLTSGQWTFLVDPAVFSGGMHLLVLEAITGSGSGSLADKAGLEAYVYRKDLNLFIDKMPHEPLHILSTQKDNGRLKITWEKYNRVDFQEYILLRTNSPYIFGPYETLAVINDTDRNYFHDSSYVGGVRYYTIAYRIRTSDAYFTSDPAKVDYPLPGILEIKPEGFDLKITFSKCLFPANFQQYQFYLNLDETLYGDTYLGSVQNINDTVFTSHGLFFGDAFMLKLATCAINISYDTENNAKPMTTARAHIGNHSFSFTRIDASPSCSEIYFMDLPLGGSLYQYYAALE